MLLHVCQRETSARVETGLLCVWGKLTYRLFAYVDVRTIEHSQNWTKHGRRHIQKKASQE